MTFIELLDELKNDLPEMAIDLLPLSLSAKTQEELCNLKLEEAGIILEHVIGLINRGSVETIESLTQEALEKHRSPEKQ